MKTFLQNWGLISYLHDLAALENVINADESDFVVSAGESLQRDQERRGGDVIAAMPIADRLTNALKILKEDGQYQKEYDLFVSSMSYAAEDELISFENALRALERIINQFCSAAANIL